MTNPNHIQRVEERLVHENPWWQVFYDRVVLPSGEEGRHMRLVSASRRPGAVVLAIQNRRDVPFVALVRQWRYAQSKSLWELPRGFGDPGDPSAAFTAARELLEETGLSPSDVTHLGDIAQDSSIIEGSVGVFLVTITETTSAASECYREVDEFRWLEWDQFLGMIRSGEITDGFSIAAVGLFTAHRAANS